jgi:hypothetical protein
MNVVQLVLRRGGLRVESGRCLSKASECSLNHDSPRPEAETLVPERDSRVSPNYCGKRK